MPAGIFAAADPNFFLRWLRVRTIVRGLVRIGGPFAYIVHTYAHTTSTNPRSPRVSHWGSQNPCQLHSAH